MSLEYGIQNHVAMAWLPDGHTVSFAGNETGQGWRIYLQDIGGGEPRPITPDILQPNTYDGPSASPGGNFGLGERYHGEGMALSDKRWRADSAAEFAARR